MKWVVLSGALASLAACSSESGASSLGPSDSGPPIAALLLPRFAAPGEAMAADGSRSLSRGGELTHFRITFGDGTPLADSGSSLVRHDYSAEGVYAVALEVEDQRGRTSRAVGQLTVRAAPPGCARDADCGGLDTCLQGRCTALFGPSCPDGGATCLTP